MAINRHMHKNLGGLSPELRELANEDVEIPEYYEINDVRKPVDRHVKDVLKTVIEELFNARSELEKTMSRRELLAYDQVMTKNLKYDVLMPKLKREIYKEFNLFEQQN